MLTKLLHGEVALLLTEVAMQTLSIISVFNQFVGNLLCLDLCSTEDDGKDTGIEIHDTLQCQVFVPGVYHVIDMIHVLGTLVAAAYHNLLVVVQVVQGNFLNFLAHRC